MCARFTVLSDTPIAAAIVKAASSRSRAATPSGCADAAARAVFSIAVLFSTAGLASGELFRTHLFIKRVYKAIFSYVHEYVVAKIAPNHSSSIDCPDSLEGTKRHHMAALRSAMVGPFLALRTRVHLDRTPRVLDGQ